MSPFTSAQDGVILCLTQDGRSVTGARVLAAGRPVVVGTVAGTVVVVVPALVERVVRAVCTQATPIAVAQQGVTLGGSAAERHGDGVAVGVASAHRLTPGVVTHDYS